MLIRFRYIERHPDDIYDLVAELDGEGDGSYNFTDTLLSAHTTFNYTVSASNVAGTSEFSDTLDVATLNNDPELTGEIGGLKCCIRW